MDKFVIEGGYPLSGTVVPAGNKNAALPILAASLLTEEELVVGNVPRIRDVESMLALLEDLGVSVTWRDEHEVALRAASISSTEVDAELAEPHPGVLPARRAAARAHRRGAHAAAGRRLHRPAPARPAPRRAARARRAGAPRPRLRDVGAAGPARRATSSWTRRA